MFRAQVNLNGDSKETLVNQARAVIDALREVETLMGVANPHGRNYQTAKPGAFDADQLEWTEARIALCNLRNKIMDSAIRIQDSA